MYTYLRISWICGQQLSGGIITMALVWAFDQPRHSITSAEAQEPSADVVDNIADMCTDNDTVLHRQLMNVFSFKSYVTLLHNVIELPIIYNCNSCSCWQLEAAIATGHYRYYPIYCHIPQFPCGGGFLVLTSVNNSGSVIEAKPTHKLL